MAIGNHVGLAEVSNSCIQKLMSPIRNLSELPDFATFFVLVFPQTSLIFRSVDQKNAR